MVGNVQLGVSLGLQLAATKLLFTVRCFGQIVAEVTWLETQREGQDKQGTSKAWSNNRVKRERETMYVIFPSPGFTFYDLA